MGRLLQRPEFSFASARLSGYDNDMTDADFGLTLTILKEIRADLGEHRRLLLQLVEASRRHDRRFEDIERRFADVERRIADTRNELELMLKGELLGRLTHFETQIDEKLARLSDRAEALETAKT